MQLVHDNFCSSASDRCELASELQTCFSSQSIEILVGRLDLEPEIIPALIELLDDSEIDRANRFVFERDRFRFIVGRARLRQALSARLDVRPEVVKLVYGGRGKPALAPHYASSNLLFNLSYSDDVAVYAFSYGRVIGVDVEAVRPFPDADEIAARFFSRRENYAYRALDSGDRPLGFFNCWTRKEAFIKALGDGFHCPLDSFDVSLAPGEPAKILRVGVTPGNDCGWSLEGFSPAPGIVVAVVTESEGLHLGCDAVSLLRAQLAEAL
jgi:4'-phosphopantetheinyl transferase